MQKASPTSLKITLRNLRAAASSSGLRNASGRTTVSRWRALPNMISSRAFAPTIVDKDRNPVWRPDKLEAVTPEIVDRHFHSVGALELKFED